VAPSNESRSLHQRTQNDTEAHPIHGPGDGRALAAGYVYNPALAARVCGFFPRFLRHTQVRGWAGKPFELLPWQRRVVSRAFGWVHSETGLRRFKRVYVEVPKKNGKSTLAAGVGLYLLVGDGEPGAEVYSVATTRKQAAIVHSEAGRMVAASPSLSRRLRIVDTTQAIYDDKTNSSYQILAADATTAQGFNIHGLVCDELHAWQGKRLREFFDSLRYADTARPQALFFIITTAGEYDPTSVGWEEHEYARRVLAGEVEDLEYDATIYAADPDDDLRAPEVHAKANPSYGVLIRPDEISKAAEHATKSAGAYVPFLRYRLNIWSQALETFFDVAKWRSCAEAFDESRFEGRTAYGGLDLATKKDVTAWALMFPPDETDDKWTALVRLFCPMERAEHRSTTESVPYVAWARDGFLTLTPGNVTAFDTIKARIIEDCQRFFVPAVHIDPWNAEYLRQQLLGEVNAELIECDQTCRALTLPMKELEALVLSGQLRHNGSPMMDWMITNTVPFFDTSARVRPDRKKSRDRIDGVVALIMALGRAMLASTTTGPSIYESPGATL